MQTGSSHLIPFKKAVRSIADTSSKSLINILKAYIEKEENTVAISGRLTFTDMMDKPLKPTNKLRVGKAPYVLIDDIWFGKDLLIEYRNAKYISVLRGLRHRNPFYKMQAIEVTNEGEKNFAISLRHNHCIYVIYLFDELYKSEGRYYKVFTIGGKSSIDGFEAPDDPDVFWFDLKNYDCDVCV